MEMFIQVLQAGVLYVCVTALVLLGIGYYFYAVDFAVRNFLTGTGGGVIMLLLAALGWYYAGMSCNHGKIKIPRTDPDAQYIYDGGSYVTNDHAYVSFSTILLPDDAEIIVAYAPDWASNETQVVKLDSMTLAQWKAIGCQKRYDWDLSWGDKANDYQWYLYTTWAPAPTVHTNGVLNCYGIATGEWTGVTKRTIVVEDGAIVSPDDEFWDFEDELEEIQNAPVYGGEERKPYELEKYFDINR